MKVDQPDIKFVPKGWGFEKFIINSDKYCGKLLYFVKGKRCSLHYHKIKDETFYVAKGKMKLYFGDNAANIEQLVAVIPGPEAVLKLTAVHTLCGTGNLREVILKQGDNFRIPVNRVHQMVAMEDTELYEFSTMHMDDDSYRIIKGD